MPALNRIRMQKTLLFPAGSIKANMTSRRRPEGVVASGNRISTHRSGGDSAVTKALAFAKKAFETLSPCFKIEAVSMLLVGRGRLFGAVVKENVHAISSSEKVLTDAKSS